MFAVVAVTGYRGQAFLFQMESNLFISDVTFYEMATFLEWTKRNGE